MAEVEEAVQDAPAPRNKKRLIVLVAAVLLIALAGTAAFMLLSGGDKEGKRADRKSAQQQEPLKTMLVPFEEKFTVNLRSQDGGTHYLQVPTLQMEVADPEVAKRLEEIKPKISDRISSLLRSKDMQAMLEPGSDVKLKEEMKKVVNETLGVRDESKGVVEVIMPQSFIVQ
jgi:flagellar FliL protein